MNDGMNDRMDDWYLTEGFAGPTSAWYRYLEIENQIRAKVGLAPTCLDCKIPAKKFITTPAQLYGVPAEDYPTYPYAFQPRWDGEWVCPKCRHLVAVTDLRKVRVKS